MIEQLKYFMILGTIILFYVTIHIAFYYYSLYRTKQYKANYPEIFASNVQKIPENAIIMTTGMNNCLIMKSLGKDDD